MIRHLYTLLAGIQALFASKHRGTDRSRLMGMYLDQANRTTGDGKRGAKSQERQDGKFAQKRGRAD
jgi:hypothetical protein